MKPALGPYQERSTSDHITRPSPSYPSLPRLATRLASTRFATPTPSYRSTTTSLGPSASRPCYAHRSPFTVSKETSPLASRNQRPADAIIHALCPQHSLSATCPRDRRNRSSSTCQDVGISQAGLSDALRNGTGAIRPMADKSRGRSNDPVWASRPSFAKIRIDAAWRRAAEPGHGGKDPLADAPLIPIRCSSHRNSWSGRFSHLPVGGLRDVVDLSRTRSESSRDSPVFKLCFSLCESQARVPLRLSVGTQRASCDSTATLRHCDLRHCDIALRLRT